MGQGPKLTACEAVVLNTCGWPDAFNAHCERAYTYFTFTYGGINPGRVESALTMELTPSVEALQARPAINNKNRVKNIKISIL